MLDQQAGIAGAGYHSLYEQRGFAVLIEGVRNGLQRLGGIKHQTDQIGLIAQGKILDRRPQKTHKNRIVRQHEQQSVTFDKKIPQHCFLLVLFLFFLKVRKRHIFRSARQFRL